MVAPKDVTGIAGAYVTAAALVPSASGGVARIYGESDVGGQTSLRFVPLDANGEPEAAPVARPRTAGARSSPARRATACCPSPDHYGVVFMEGWFDPDPRVMEGNSVVGLAIVDEQGTARATACRRRSTGGTTCGRASSNSKIAWV